MKISCLNPKAITLTLCTLATMLSIGAKAQQAYFTTNVVNNGTYSWDAVNWGTNSVGTYPYTWTNGSFARFYATRAANYTVTVANSESFVGMYQNGGSGVTTTFTNIGGGSLNISTTGGSLVNGKLVQGFLCNGNIVLAVPITGSGGIEQENNNTISLYANNTYAGGTDLTGGQTINFNNNNSFGTGPITDNGNTMVLANTTASALTIANPITISNSGYNLTLSGGTAGTTFSGGVILQPGTVNFIVPSSQTTELSGAVSGASGITNTGGGTLILSGPNTYTGGTTNSSATLVVTTIADSVSGSLNPTTNTLALNAGTFRYNGSTAATTARAIVLTGTGSTIDLPNGNLTVNGQVRGGTFTKTSAGTLTLGGSADNASLGLNVNGGKVILNKTSTSSVHGIGAASTVNGGTLQLAGSGGFEISSAVALTVTNGGVVDANGQSDTFTSLTLSGNGGGSGTVINNSATTSTLTCTAATAFNVAADATIGGSGNLTLTGLIGGAHALTYAGAGTLKMLGTNSYSGNTTISSGTLALSATASIASSPVITIASGASLDVSNHTGNVALGAGQQVSVAATGANTTGKINTGATAALTLSASGLAFTAYGGGSTSPLTASGTGALILNSAPITITTTTVLPMGVYKLIAASGSAAVTGTPGTLTINGSGAAATASLIVVAGQLYLGVGTVILGTATTAVFTNTYGTPSPVQSFPVGGFNLTTDVTAAAPAGFEISSDGSAYGAGATYTQTGGSAGGILYLRIAAASPVAGSYNSAAVALTTTGASTAYITTPATGNVVNPAPLSITASNATMTYDGSAFSGGNGVAYSGFVNGENTGVLTGTLSYGGTSQGATTGGTYTIIPSGFSAANYAITYLNGSLVINRAAPGFTLISSANPSGYYDSLSFVANNFPADATSNVVFTASGMPFSTNNLAGAGATSLAITNLLHGTNVIAAIYAGDINYQSATMTLNQLVTNHPPVAAPVSYTRNVASPSFKIALTNLLANVTDVDGDTIALVSTGTSTNGITLINSGGYLLYYNTNAVADQFTYTVADSYGGTNSALVSINIDTTPVFGQSSVFIGSPGGPATLSFAGIPGYSYSVLRSPDLISWMIILTTNAPAGGLFQYIDATPPQPSAYYQLEYNSGP